jgi:cysteine synthase A
VLPDALALVGRTPVVRLRHTPPGSAEVVCKCEWLNPGGSVKDRIALAMVEAAEREGRLKPGDTIVEATSGNTGIGLAVVCAVKGYRLVLTMPEDMNAERRALFAWYGVELVLTPAIEGMSGAVFAAEEIVRQRGAFWPRQFENPHNPEAHETGTGPELYAQCGGRLDAFVAGVGTGGTLTGTARFLRSRLPGIRVVAVEPARSPVLSGGRPGPHRLLGLGAGFVPGVLDRSLIDQVLCCSDEDGFETARWLACREGLLVGPSSGAAVWAALRVAAELGPGKRVACVLPDGGDRYASLLPWALRRTGGEGGVPGPAGGAEPAGGAPIGAPAERIVVPDDLRAAMVAHALAERPLEACGLVGGRGERAVQFVPTRNRLRSPTRYDVEPEDLLRATLAIEAAGLEVWGIFHSHPATEAYPSQTDVQLAFYPQAYYLICSLADPARPVLRAFRIVDGTVREVRVDSR